MVGLRGFVCQVVPIFRTKPQCQMEQQGAAIGKGRCALNPTLLTSRQPVRTQSSQRVALRALHSLRSVCSDITEKRIKAKNTSFCKERGISAQQTLCMGEG